MGKEKSNNFVRLSLQHYASRFRLRTSPGHKSIRYNSVRPLLHSSALLHNSESGSRCAV